MFSADLGVNQVASNPPATDPLFNKVALLLHGDGTNGAQNNTFLDSSTNNFTITRTGNVAQGTFSPFSLAEGQWSNYLDGTGDYFTLSSNTALAPESSAFTWECWFYPTDTWAQTASGGDCLWYTAVSGGLQIGRTNTATGNRWGVARSGVAWVLTTTTLPTLNQWNHMVVVRSGTGTNEASLFLNGVNVANGTLSTSFGAGNMELGRGTAGFESTGYLSNVRFVKGTAVYDPAASTITVPTTPLTVISNTQLLTCQSNRFNDNSSNNFTITRNGDAKITAWSPFVPSAAYSASTNGGSGYWDGTGDLLSIADTSALNLNSTAFSVEYWIYPTVSATTITVMGKMSGFTTNPTAGWSMWLSSMRPTFGINGVFNSLLAPAANAIPVGAWSHIAATSDGSTYTNLYVNGVRVATSASVNTTATALPFVLGGNINGTTWNNTYYTTGYIMDARVIKGTSLASGTTYPMPTSPLTAVSNTQLLLNCVNASIYDNAAKNDIETVGNAQISTSVKKYGTGSMYFDGTGDWLLLADRPEIQLASGDFTVECWLYLGATGSAQGIVGKGTGTTGWLLSTNSSNQLVYTDGSSTTTGGTALSGTTWYHVAVVRNGSSTGNVKIYLNGVLDATSSGAVTTSYTQTNVMYVGASRTGTTPITGYIDDLRITKGQALYTSNFTPPTQAFPNV